MRIIYCILFIIPTMCFANELHEVPSFYLKPNLHGIFAEYPPVIDNGYFVIDSVQVAQKFLQPIPPDVNFDSEMAIIFAWNGSGEDKIDHEKREDVYHFVYKRGMTKDLKHHVKIVIIPKQYQWVFHRVIE